MIIPSRLESAHLAGNLLGDPSERALFVYLAARLRRIRPPVSDGLSAGRRRAHLLGLRGRDDRARQPGRHRRQAELHRRREHALRVAVS
jgi:hypothetical protein